MRAITAALLLAWSGAAWAESHTVAIVNGGSGTMREIYIAPPGRGLGANRLRTRLPPRAAAEIGYSTGCHASVTLVFDQNRTETFADQDVCAGLRIVSGQGVSQNGVATLVGSPKSKSSFQPAHVDVPWTGRSITHKFGGLN